MASPQQQQQHQQLKGESRQAADAVMAVVVAAAVAGSQADLDGCRPPRRRRVMRWYGCGRRRSRAMPAPCWVPPQALKRRMRGGGGDAESGGCSGNSRVTE